MTRSMATGVCCLVLLVSLASAANPEEQDHGCDPTCRIPSPGCVAEVIKACQAIERPPAPSLDPEAWRCLSWLGTIGLGLWFVKAIVEACFKHVADKHELDLKRQVAAISGMSKPE